MRLKSKAPLYVLSLSVISCVLCSKALANLGLSFTKNKSISAPSGLYLLKGPKALSKGMLVTFPLPRHVKRFMRKVPWLREGEPLLKRVGALSGDKVCRKKDLLFLNGELLAKAKAKDRFGNKLPRWKGCKTLKENEFLPISLYHENSFDGRYFGVLRKASILKEALPFITF